jgi:hypothetical protein
MARSSVGGRHSWVLTLMTRALFPPARILALDVHPTRYGYAVLELPAELLDWGVRRQYLRNAPRSVNWVRKSFRDLLDRWRPSLIVTKELSKPATSRLKRISASLVAEARCFGIPVRSVREAAILSTFGGGRFVTKYHMAQMLVQRFSFLAFLLPPLRKIYESQDYRMSIFAAVALALTAIAQKLRKKF